METTDKQKEIFARYRSRILTIVLDSASTDDMEDLLRALIEKMPREDFVQVVVGNDELVDAIVRAWA